MNDKITETDLRALAHLLGRIRPDWQTPGILAALSHETPLSLPLVAVAAIIAAADLDNRTPKILELDGRHRRNAAAALSGAEVTTTRPPETPMPPRGRGLGERPGVPPTPLARLARARLREEAAS